MTARAPRERPSVEGLLKAVGKGRPLAPPVGEALGRLLGVPVGLDGLSRLFQPGFPGVRTFVTEARVAPDHAVEFTLVGVARSGHPVWTGTRAVAYGRDGSLEIHRGFDEVEPRFQSRNITVDLMQRELDLLGAVDSGPAARLTIDAEHVGRYVCALHGFVFADETDEGPPVRSTRALEPEGDRQALEVSARALAERLAARSGLSRERLDATLAAIGEARTPWDFARLELGAADDAFAASDDREVGVGTFGRELLLNDQTPGWRAALYVVPRHEEAWRLGATYRLQKTARSETRLAQQVQEARDALENGSRAARQRALETLGMIGPSWLAQELKPHAEGTDRRLAAVARQTLRLLSGADLADQLLAFADDPRHEARLRGHAYRVLAEHFPGRLAGRVPMLRVHPDARVQRAVIPLAAEDVDDAGPALAALLAANPWDDGERPGLLAMRLELIDALTRIADPRTLPALMAAYRSPRPAPQAEQLALARALVAIPDPRAQVVLAESTRRMPLPQIP